MDCVIVVTVYGFEPRSFRLSDFYNKAPPADWIAYWCLSPSLCCLFVLRFIHQLYTRRIKRTLGKCIDQHPNLSNWVRWECVDWLCAGILSLVKQQTLYGSKEFASSAFFVTNNFTPFCSKLENKTNSALKWLAADRTDANTYLLISCLRLTAAKGFVRIGYHSPYALK